MFSRYVHGGGLLTLLVKLKDSSLREMTLYLQTHTTVPVCTFSHKYDTTNTHTGEVKTAIFAFTMERHFNIIQNGSKIIDTNWDI